MGDGAAEPSFRINLHFFRRPCLLKYEVRQWPAPSTHHHHPPNTGGAQTSVKGNATRRSPVSPAARRDEETADPSLTTSPG